MGVLRHPSDEHHTSDPLLVACARALVAPALLSGSTELDELSVACRVASRSKSGRSRSRWVHPTDQESKAGSDSLVLLSLDAPCELVKLQTRRLEHGWTCLSGQALSFSSPAAHLSLKVSTL